jgi:hypothetical protein
MPHISCPVAVHANVTCHAAGVAVLREGSVPGAPLLPPRFLRHADEHTVVGIRAVQEAMAALGLRQGSSPAGATDRFAIVAAPCGAGRPASARTLVSLRDGGPVTVSPHVVPQCSLHAVASAVSVGLRIHGPNIGVGGGPEALSEAFITALSLLAEPGVEGCWLVLTAWDEEPALDDRGNTPADAVCRGVALALDRAAAGSLELSLRVEPSLTVIDDASPTFLPGQPSLAELAAFLDRAARGGGGDRDKHDDGCGWSFRLGWGAMVHLELDLARLGARERRRDAA